MSSSYTGSFASSRVGHLNRAFSLSVIVSLAAQDELTPFTPLSATSSSFVSDAHSMPSSPSETLIDPYALSTTPLLIYNFLRYAGTTASNLLANSGVSTWTDYAVSTSPRGDVREIDQLLEWLSRYTNPPLKKIVGYVPSSEKSLDQWEVDVSLGFQPFSYTAERQVKTHTAAVTESSPLSPCSKPAQDQISVFELDWFYV